MVPRELGTNGRWCFGRIISKLEAFFTVWHGGAEEKIKAASLGGKNGEDFGVIVAFINPWNRNGNSRSEAKPAGWVGWRGCETVDSYGFDAA